MEDKEAPAYYAVIPASVRYDKSLTPNAKILYGEITALCNDKGFCWASNTYFAELYDVTPQAISRWINLLSSLGYVKLEYEYNGKEVKQRRIYIKDVSINGLGVSIKSSRGINKKLNGYQQKVKENITYNNKKEYYTEIEDAYRAAFNEVIPNKEPIIDYGAVRKRQKTLLECITKDKIIQAINTAKKDAWIIDNGFSLLTILSNGQLNKLLNGKCSTQYKQKQEKKNCPACGKELTGLFCKHCMIQYNENMEELS